MTTVCAIHQPNFFPWLGYFDKIAQSDVLILLDDVDYPRSGSSSMGSRCNRVRLRLSGQEQWFGCAVQRMPLGSSIRQATLLKDSRWRRKLKSSLKHGYAGAPSRDRALAVLEPLIDFETDLLCEFNRNAIEVITRHLGLEPRFRWSSEFELESNSTERLVELVKAVGADTYLSGRGAGGYMDETAFGAAGLSLKYQDFTPLPYGDPDSFVPGLSVIDFLMNSEDWSWPTAKAA